MISKLLYGPTILIAEDESKILQSIVRKVKEVAPTSRIVATASDGAQALELVKKHRPNVVFTDIKMPNMDGLELAKNIGDMFPNVYVVIISGHSDFQFARRAIKYGVTDYLLKPVDKDKLKEVLEEITIKLETISQRIDRSFIISPQQQADPLQPMIQGKWFGVLFFNFYNLCYDALDEDLKEIYKNATKDLDWDAILSVENFKLANYAISDEYVPNQKGALLAFGSADVVDLQRFAGQVFENMEELYPELPVSIAFHRDVILRSNIWAVSKRMRNTMSLAIVPAVSAIIPTDPQEQQSGNEDMLDAIKQQIKNNIKEFVASKSKPDFRENLQKIVRYLFDTAMPQKQVEKLSAFLLVNLEYVLEQYDVEQSEQAQIDFYRTLSLSQRTIEIEAKLQNCVDILLNSHDNAADQTGVGNDIVAYIDANFTTINSIKDLAEMFSYNPTYLSRLFKKISGTTASKYIMVKRMELAKSLFESTPEISVGTVSELVGYEDQQYFSRVFRSLVGVSPSEYKVRPDNEEQTI